MKKLVLLCLIAACGDNIVPEEDAHAQVVEDCGEAPLRPGVVLASDGRYIQIDRAVWLGLDAWMQQLDGWTYCVQGK